MTIAAAPGFGPRLKLLGHNEEFVAGAKDEGQRHDVRCGRQLVYINQFMDSLVDPHGVDWSSRHYFEQGNHLLFTVPLYKAEIEVLQTLMETDLSLLAYLEVQRPQFRFEVLRKGEQDELVDWAFRMVYRSPMRDRFPAAAVGRLSCENVQQGKWKCNKWRVGHAQHRF